MNKMIQIILAIVIVVIVVGLIYISVQNERRFKEQKANPEQANETEEVVGGNTVTFKTNQGDIILELFTEQTPKTVENFKTLASEGFYDGVRFHRVIKGFMVQSGDPLSKDVENKMVWGTGGPDYKFEDEFVEGLSNSRGTISMANAGPNTNGSQFFINTVDNNFLDGKHTVFGKVVEGMDVVDKIENTETGERDIPVEDMIIESVVLE